MTFTIDIVAPGARCKPEVVTHLKTLLSTWGFTCHVPDDLFGPDLLSSNSIEKRFEQLKQALSNSTSKAVWCLLGGYGSAKLIPLLQKLPPIQQTKLFIGFSDITALHIFLNQAWGWETIHGPQARQVAELSITPESIAAIKHLLMGEPYASPLDQATPLNQAAKALTDINAPVIGGNLTLIQNSIGTSWQLDAKNKILFIEEVKERAYRVDRSLEHLRQAGIFSGAKAIVLGDFTESHEPDGTMLIDDVLKQFAAESDVPVFKVHGVGHGKVNFPIVFGKKRM